VAIALALLLAQLVGAQAPLDLSAAKALYASGAYEEALTALSRMTKENPGQVEQYRALCLLALGRTSEARRSLERMVMLQPRDTITDSDGSEDLPPPFLVMFHDVRRQVLPVAARDIYAKAKANVEAEHYAAASAQLKEMLAILADADLSDQADNLADLTLFGKGFLALAQFQLAAAATPALAAPASKIYSASDHDVTAPVEIERRVPVWASANPAAQKDINVGAVVIVIDEKGAVESAVIRTSVNPSYDAVLLEAAKKWQFRPARLKGQPVKYRKSYEIMLWAR
jgi:TonB family protein